MFLLMIRGHSGRGNREEFIVWRRSCQRECVMGSQETEIEEAAVEVRSGFIDAVTVTPQPSSSWKLPQPLKTEAGNQVFKHMGWR